MKVSLEKLQFGFNDKLAVSILYTFEKGNIYSVTGENGSEKSTLCELLLGIFAGEYKGKIMVNDI